MVVKSPDADLSALQTLAIHPGKWTSYDDYHNAVIGQMVTWLKQIDDPEQLRTLFWECHSASRTAPRAPQEMLQRIDPHAESGNLILYRLADMHTPDAAKVLVDLWSDSKAGWDGGRAEMAGDAVVICGKAALPFLRDKKDSGRNTARLIELIESGANTGL